MYYLKSLSWRMTVLSSLQPFKNEILKVIAAIPLLRVLRFFTDLISLIFHSNTLGNPVVQTATQSLPTNAREVSLLLVSSSTWCMLQLWKHSPLGIFSGSCYKLCLSAAAKRFPLCPLCIYLYGPPKFVLSLSLAALRELQYQIEEWGAFSKACWQNTDSPTRGTSDKFVNSNGMDVKYSNGIWMWNEYWRYPVLCQVSHSLSTLQHKSHKENDKVYQSDI